MCRYNDFNNSVGRDKKNGRRIYSKHVYKNLFLKAVLCAFSLKVCESDNNMSKESSFSKKIQHGYKNAEFYADLE